MALAGPHDAQVKPVWVGESQVLAAGRDGGTRHRHFRRIGGQLGLRQSPFRRSRPYRDPGNSHGNGDDTEYDGPFPYAQERLVGSERGLEDCAPRVYVSLHPLQVGSQVRGGLVAQLAVFLQRPLNDLSQLGPQVAIDDCGGDKGRAFCIVNDVDRNTPRLGCGGYLSVNRAVGRIHDRRTVEQTGPEGRGEPFDPAILHHFPEILVDFRCNYRDFRTGFQQKPSLVEGVYSSADDHNSPTFKIEKKREITHLKGSVRFSAR